MRILKLLLTLAFLSALLLPTARSQAPLFGDLHWMIPPDVDRSDTIAMLDVDGDGDLDALIGNGGSSPGFQNRLYLNDGTGAFVDATASLPQVIDNSWAIAVGDVDGDLDLDVLIGNSWGNRQNRLYLNDGMGGFVDATSALPIDSDLTYAAILADVDGDGDLDALLGNDYAGQNRLYSNDGSGVFSDATSQLPPDSDSTTSAAMGDVDGDQDLDVLFGNRTNGQGRLYLNDGTGIFVDFTANLPQTSLQTYAVDLSDLDGDLDLDAVLGHAGSTGGQPNGLYLNDGSGVFVDATAQLPTDSDSTLSLAVSDVEGDQDLDLFIGNAGEQNRLYLNDGSASFTDASGALPADTDKTYAAALEDLDADGDVDALLVNLDSQNVLLLNDGVGGFFDVTADHPANSSGRTFVVRLGDVDGDGDLDAMLGRLQSIHLFLNDGIGGLSDSPALLPDSGETAVSDIALGDVDGDGDLDALLATWDNMLYVNDGTGSFSDATANLPGGFGSGVVLGDQDGDGDLDAVIADGDPGYDEHLYRNDGTGVFVDIAGSLPPNADRTTTPAVGDVDGDGDPDLLLGSRDISGQSAQDHLYLNDGAGFFTDATSHLPTLSNITYDLTLGDVDDDGDLDAWIADAALHRLYLNDGAGVFSDVTSTQIPTVVGLKVIALVDVDGDRDLDALHGGRLELNDGAGFFSDASAMLPQVSITTYAIATGDMDGDQDLDAYLGHGWDRLLRSLIIQLSWRGIPRVGKPLTLDVYGTPGDAWLLLASLGTANIPLPYGTFRLDPSLLFTVGSGALDAQGQASVTLPVPSNPALVGLPLYWQSVLAFPLALTNLEVTTFTGL